MQDVIHHFIRDGIGRWTCIKSVVYKSPVGRVHVATGTTVMRGIKFENFDLAAELDREYERQQAAARI